MDMLDGLVYLLVLFVGVLFPLAGAICIYVWPPVKKVGKRAQIWSRELWKDWRAFRAERRVEKKRAAYNQWKDTKKWTA